MKRQIDEKEALRRLQNTCSKSEHCCQEAREKLWRWGVDSTLHERIIASLVDDGFIDDERFCRAFVNDKIEFNHWGRHKIEQALYKKRIDKKIIDSTLNTIANERYIEKLRPLIENRRRQMPPDIKKYDIDRRLITFALSRGYSFEVIRAVIEGADDIDCEHICDFNED